MPLTTTSGQPGLFRHPVARFVVVTAFVGSLADWTLFASLVAVVDGRTAGSAWATAAVLLARVLPATLFAPVAARRVDRRDLRATLATQEAMRAAVVAVIAVLAPTSPLLMAAVLLVGLEFAAAMLAAGRESMVSRHVPAFLHTQVNTATAITSYGLLPVGAVVVQALGVGTSMAVAAGAYGLLLVSYLTRWPGVGGTVGVVEGVVVPAGRDAGEARTPADPAALARTVLAAAIGLAPVVALFTVAPRLAEHWLGDATATGLPLGLLLAGAAVGLVLANRGGRDAVGLGIAAAGFAVSALGAWQVGILLAGVGAGLGYLALQTRLQAEARDPSQFARAFAVLKISTIAGTLAGPTAWELGGPTLLLGLSGTAALGASMLASANGSTIRSLLRGAVRGVVRRLVHLVVRIEVVGRRHDGPAVVASNHPNALDGVVALAADPSLRPIARWQANPVARAGFWVADAVVTTAGTDRGHRPAWEQAAAHLDDGGRIWLAPEGGAHDAPVLRAPRSGAVRMAHAAQVPVQALGVRHHGSHAGPRLRSWRPWRRPRVTLVWGDLVLPTGVVERDNDAMMSAIAQASGTLWHGDALAVAA